jgi:hypothetical protein
MSSCLVKVSGKVARGTELKVAFGTPVLCVISISCTTITRNDRAHLRRVKVERDRIDVISGLVGRGSPSGSPHRRWATESVHLGRQPMLLRH